MEQSSENKIEFKDKFLRFFYTINIYFLNNFFIAISSIIYMENYNNQNKLIAEIYSSRLYLHLKMKKMQFCYLKK